VPVGQLSSDTFTTMAGRGKRNQAARPPALPSIRGLFTGPLPRRAARPLDQTARPLDQAARPLDQPPIRGFFGAALPPPQRADPVLLMPPPRVYSDNDFTLPSELHSMTSMGNKPVTRVAITTTSTLASWQQSCEPSASTHHASSIRTPAPRMS
jgi:hypothetical protein